jgi:alkanesulfonate monooxygenase SsuD/methylene tetrahydromethanopterin reductase-like flavin-dependent oxidoreductase (luciferase family)
MSMLGALAVSTERIQLGPGVSHLAGRHPSVIASAMATLEDLAPGRIRLGIGVGDSGPLNLGVPRTSLRDLEAAVVAIRDLIEGREVTGPTRPLKLGFGSPDRRIPIYVSGSGERTHRMAGRVADGALISGMPDEFPRSIESVRTGEQEAGRPKGTTRLLFWTTAAVDDDRDAARAAVRGSVARRVMNSYARPDRRGQLDADELQALDRLQAAHNRGHLWDQDYTELVLERWVDRFAIAGTPDEVRSRLDRAIQQGAEEISLILMTPSSRERGSADQLTRFAETVMAPMRDAVGASPI